MTLASTYFLDFWMTETTYTEQPNVRHLNEMLVLLYTENQTYTFGTTENLNEMLGAGNQAVP